MTGAGLSAVIVLAAASRAGAAAVAAPAELATDGLAPESTDGSVLTDVISGLS